MSGGVGPTGNEKDATSSSMAVTATGRLLIIILLGSSGLASAQVMFVQRIRNALRLLAEAVSQLLIISLKVSLECRRSVGAFVAALDDCGLKHLAMLDPGLAGYRGWAGKRSSSTEPSARVVDDQSEVAEVGCG